MRRGSRLTASAAGANHHRAVLAEAELRGRVRVRGPPPRPSEPRPWRRPRPLASRPPPAPPDARRAARAVGANGSGKTNFFAGASSFAVHDSLRR